MTAPQFYRLICFCPVLEQVIKLWLAYRQLDHVAANRAEVPAAFREKVDLAAHQKAADYTRALVQLGMLTVLFDTVLLLAFTLGGGIQWLSTWSSATFSGPLVQGVAIIVSVLLLQSVLESPFDLYRTFNIEARFGFNKMTLKLYLLDALKGLLLGAALGLPLLLGVLWLMSAWATCGGCMCGACGWCSTCCCCSSTPPTSRRCSTTSSRCRTKRRKRASKRCSTNAALPPAACS